MSSIGDKSSQPTAESNPGLDTGTATPTATTDGNGQVTFKKPRNRTSEIWDHFTKVLKDNGTKPERARCNYCSSEYVFSSAYGTSTFWKHLNNKCAKYPFNKDKRQKTLGFVKEEQEEDSKLVAWKFDQALCREALAKMIILDELPFKFVEHEGFKYFCSIMQPRFQLVSRITIARDCLELYVNLKKGLKKALTTATTRVCLTTDTWTSLQNMNYMVLTTHFIDNNWKLQKRILNFSIISSHKGVAIGQAIESCMLQWGIDKVFRMTMDNVSSNDTAILHLRKRLRHKNAFILDGDFFHVRCSAHILNLIVRDGIKEVEESIFKIRSAVKYIRSSPQRSQQFKVCCEQEKITCKSTWCLDVPTRWNYTYLMLETALKFQKAFETLEILESNFRNDLNNEVPSYEDWDNARVLTKFLQTFYDVTNRLSGSLYVTSNMYFHEICEIEELLSEWSKSGDITLSRMAMKMKLKFNKYWGEIGNINKMLLIAVVLDPRYKLRYVEFCYNDIYPMERVNMLIESVREVFNRMYVHYPILDSSSCSTKSTQGSNEIEVDKPDNEGMKVKSRVSKYMKLLEEEQNVDSQSEIDRYLEEGVEKNVENFEILNWWKTNSPRYKILSAIARDVLAIPVSTVASESAFSTGGRVLDRFRTSLTPKIAECLICAQDWLRASPLPIEVEERLDDLSDLESVLTEDPELVVVFSNANVLR